MILRSPFGVAMAVALTFSGVARAEPASTAQLDRIARAFTTRGAFMGSVLAFQGDRVLLYDGFGKANADWDIPNAPNVRYRIGSVTKQFTAALVLQLKDEGKLKLSDRISTYLPGVPASWSEITIAELLGHTSGIVNFTSLPEFGAWAMTPRTPADMLAFIKDKPLDFPPGSKFAYSNSGFEVLGMLIEKLTGKSYAEVLRTRILEPVGMKDSGLDTDGLIVARRAQGYNLDNGKLEIAVSESLSVPWAAGSMYSTPADLMRWIRALFAGKVVSAPSLKEMTTPGKGGYGFGLFIHDRDGVKVVEHGGGIEGFIAQLTYAPDRDTGAVVLSNVVNGGPPVMANQLLDAALGKSVTPVDGYIAHPAAAGMLEACAGAFKTDDGFDFTFTVKDGSLYQSIGSHPPTALLFQRSSNGVLEFYDPVFFSTVLFTLGADGKATKVSSTFGGQNLVARRHA